MNLEILKEQIDIEFESLNFIIKEIISLRDELITREPTTRERAAISSFLSEYYTGVENILKCICRYKKVKLPIGEYWHIELFKLFSSSEPGEIPLLFNEKLKSEFEPIRRFRHVVHHGYSYKIDWDRLREGIKSIESNYASLKSIITSYLSNQELDIKNKSN